MTRTHAELSALSDDLMAKVSAVLKGHDPQLQSFVLAEAVGLYLAGHAPELREPILALITDTARTFAKGYAPALDALRDRLKQ